MAMANEIVLGRIHALVKDCLQSLMSGSLPLIKVDKFQIRDIHRSTDKLHGSLSSVFENSGLQESISFKSSSGANRILAMLRLLQIVQQLLNQNKHASKRDIYYTDPRLFQDPRTVDQALRDVCIKLKCPRTSLHVVSVSKGLVMGQLRYNEGGRSIDCSSRGIGSWSIPMHCSQVTHISSIAKYIIIVEKETVFHRLANDGFCLKNPCIVITGKGYPDVPTRSFLKLLIDTLQIQAFALVDGDPYGLDILSIFRFGSLTMAYDADALATPGIHWLGVFLSDCDRHNISKKSLLPLTKRGTILACFVYRILQRHSLLGGMYICLGHRTLVPSVYAPILNILSSSIWVHPLSNACVSTSPLPNHE